MSPVCLHPDAALRYEKSIVVLKVEELHRGYLKQEAEVTKEHIGRLFTLYRQARREHRVIRKWISRLYPGWSRIFDEATRQASRDNSAQT